MGLRTILKRYLPERHTFQDHRNLRFFGRLLHDPDIWHITRRSTAGGVAVGLFCAFIPVPIQMVIAAGVAILLRVNLALAVIFAWLSNPITIAPMFIFAYKIGTWLLNVPTQQVMFDFSLQWFTDTFIFIWKPLLLGCFILGSLSAATGYIAFNLLWRLALVRKWEARRDRRLKTKKENTDR